MKILGIDYGSKRIGVAVGDKAVKITRALDFVENKGKNFVIEKIRNICTIEEVEEIVIGLPLGLRGNETEQTKATKEFACDLKKAIDIPIILEDERLTTRLALDSMRMRKTSRDKRREKVDSIAAQLILQGYLEKVKP